MLLKIISLCVATATVFTNKTVLAKIVSVSAVLAGYTFITGGAVRSYYVDQISSLNKQLDGLIVSNQELVSSNKEFAAGFLDVSAQLKHLTAVTNSTQLEVVRGSGSLSHTVITGAGGSSTNVYVWFTLALVATVVVVCLFSSGGSADAGEEVIAKLPEMFRDCTDVLLKQTAAQTLNVMEGASKQTAEILNSQLSALRLLNEVHIAVLPPPSLEVIAPLARVAYSAGELSSLFAHLLP